MDEVQKAIAFALSEAESVYEPQLAVLRKLASDLQGELMAFKLVADGLAQSATTTDRQSAAALLDIAVENWDAAPENLPGFEAAREMLQAMLLRR